MYSLKSETAATDAAKKNRTLKITSVEALESAIAQVVNLKNQHTAALAKKDAEVIAVEQRHQLTLTSLADQIAEQEEHCRKFCDAHRDDLFPVNKSRNLALADYGYEFTGWRVETTKKVTAAEAIKRLLRTAWGKIYVRTPTKQTLDKELLLKDREKLTAAQCEQAGILFANDEQFYIRPKPETAKQELQA